MEKYDLYAKNKIEIIRLTKECEELAKELLPLTKVWKTKEVELGKFTITTRKSYKFSETVENFEKDLKEKVSILKEQEIESGVAQESVSESLMFIAKK